jgi:hypothetical protein
MPTRVVVRGLAESQLSHQHRYGRLPPVGFHFHSLLSSSGQIGWFQIVPQNSSALRHPLEQDRFTEYL